MSTLSIQPTYPIFTDIDGQPLEDGYVWIGEANLDPQTNPIDVYWDAALTIPAAQPIRTLAGYPANSGAPARLYVNSDYSIRVMNKNGNAVYSAPVATERYNGVVVQVDASQVMFIQDGAGAVERTVESKLREVVSVKDFGAVGDGVTDDTAAIQTAINENPGRVIYFPHGSYKVSSTIVLPFEGYDADPAKVNNAVTLAGEPSDRQIFGTTKIFGNVVGPIIQAVGVYNGPSGIDFDATVGHGIQNLSVQNTNPSTTTSIGVQMAYIYCPHIINVEVKAKAICVDLGNWTMVGNFDNVSTGDGEFGVKARACWASVWKHGRAFYHKCAMYIDASDFHVIDYNAEHNGIVYDFIGSSVVVTNSHIEDFDCLYTNDQDPITQVDAAYANAGSVGNGDFPSLVSFTGGFYLGWTQNAPYFVERPTTLAQINTLHFSNCQVDNLSSPNQITVAGAFNDATPTANGRLDFRNNYPQTSFLFDRTSAGERQSQYISQFVDQISTSKVTNHYISKLRVGELTSNTTGSFYPANRAVSAGAVATWTRTVVGARVTDYVLYQHGTDNPNLLIRAFVSSNDTVTITAYNPTGATQSLGDNVESLLVFPRTAGNFATI